MKRPYRVVVATHGFNDDDRGVGATARALRDEGFEVIYTGLHQTAEEVVRAVLQEDADALALSLSPGGHLALIARVVDGLRQTGLGDVMVLVEGAVLGADVPALQALGVLQVHPPDTTPGAALGQALDARESGEVA